MKHQMFRHRRRGPVFRSSALAPLSLVLTAALTGCGSSPGPRAAAPTVATLGAARQVLQNGYLSEQLEVATQLDSGWGPIEKNLSNGDSDGGDGERLSLSNIKYTKGLGVHADSTVEFPLDGSCTRFQASVGVDDSVRAGGKYNARGLSSVVFQVYLADQKVFDSGTMTEHSATQVLDLKVPASARTLRLVVTDAGDGIAYDHADWANARVECGSAAPAAPTTQPPSLPANVAYRSVSAQMWAEIDAQATQVGDPHRCHDRVNAIAASGEQVSPGGSTVISEALQRSKTVVLRGGTYRLSETLDLSGKTLIGAPGQEVTLDASGVLTAVQMGQGGVLSNVKITDARNVGVVLGSSGTLYRVSVARTGRSGLSSGYLSTNGRAYVRGSDDSADNCLVSTEARDSYNDRRYDGTSDGVTDEGGNGDGYVVASSTLIDSFSYNNSDDGFDFWESRQPMYVYFSEAFDGGKSALGFPNAAGKSGDGNGFKLGRGDQAHFIYKSKAYSNKQSGFDLNGNTRFPVIVGSEAYGNGLYDWAQGLTGNTR